MGASAKSIWMRDSCRCASSPANRSRTTARPTTKPAPAKQPCKARNTSSDSIDCDSAQPTEPIACTAMVPMITGLRPIESLIAP